MAPTSAVEFLSRFAFRFENPVVRGWAWSPEDDDFNKTEAWQKESVDFLQTIATVDLGLTLLLLTITERPVDDSDGTDAHISFSAAVSFEERTILINGEPLPYDDESIASVIAQFNAASEH